MNRLKIKVCGMKEPDNISRLARLKPDMMGFVFYPSSPRFAGSSPAPGMFEKFPAGIIKTGVFVDEDQYSINAQVLRFGLHAVQLHGDESPEICKQLQSSGIQVIKAFRINEETNFSKMMKYVSFCKWFLFDTASSLPGGSGERFNWNLLGNYKLGHPFFLSGGIGPSDAEQILLLNHVSLAGVDINSRFETEPGVKNLDSVERFITKIRNGI